MKKELDEDAPEAKIKTKGLLNSNLRTLKHTIRFMLEMNKGAIGPPPTKYDFKFRKCIEYGSILITLTLSLGFFL